MDESVSCTFCGETLSVFAHPPHVCPTTGPLLTKSEAPSNRFDPYEALDAICFTVREVRQHESNELNWESTQIIMEQLHALRAYITGMEK
jgi:hypothetical protein